MKSELLPLTLTLMRTLRPSARCYHCAIAIAAGPGRNLAVNYEDEAHIEWDLLQVVLQGRAVRHAAGPCDGNTGWRRQKTSEQRATWPLGRAQYSGSVRCRVSFTRSARCVSKHDTSQPAASQGQCSARLEHGWSMAGARGPGRSGELLEATAGKGGWRNFKRIDGWVTGNCCNYHSGGTAGEDCYR